jgi:hypothetical protein
MISCQNANILIDELFESVSVAHNHKNVFRILGTSRFARFECTRTQNRPAFRGYIGLRHVVVT